MLINKDIINQKEYDFLRTNPHLGDKIMLLGYGGSHAYGTNVEGSDIDIRGIALNTKNEILLGRPFEQVIDNATDTVIYSFIKVVKLLSDANPNVLEMLFLEPNQYLYLNSVGEELLKNRKMFLSKRILYTFGGYARAQLNRLDNKVMRNLDQPGQEEHIMRSIQNAASTFPDKYFSYPEDSIKLYIDDAVQEGMQTEIFMDVNLKHYPLRDYKCMWAEMHNVVKDYSRIGKRAKAAEHGNKINKHAMHLCRLMLTCIEILETCDMHTYRAKDHDFLMDIRNGRYMVDGKMTEEFFGIVADLDAKMQEAAKTTKLPEKPDYKAIDKFVCKVNEMVVCAEK